jgi:hypothetical protein
MKNAIMVLIVAMAFSSCTSARISSEMASGAIGCRPNEITILNETASFSGGRHNFEAICKGKLFICSYHSSTGMNCKEALDSKNTTYEVLENGDIKDTETGLEWKLGENWDITWYEAKAWVQKLKSDGWRMPTENEVDRLYNKGVQPRNVPPLILADGWPIWLSEAKGEDGKFTYLYSPPSPDWYKKDGSSSMRVIAVRSPSK